MKKIELSEKTEQNIVSLCITSLSDDGATREGPSLTTPSNANRVSVRSEEVGDGLPCNATSSFEAIGE